MKPASIIFRPGPRSRALQEVSESCCGAVGGYAGEGRSKPHRAWHGARLRPLLAWELLGGPARLGSTLALSSSGTFTAPIEAACTADWAVQGGGRVGFGLPVLALRVLWRAPATHFPCRRVEQCRKKSMFCAGWICWTSWVACLTQ